jgi:regulator of chromosome condensation
MQIPYFVENRMIITAISCGGMHTAIVTDTGRLFTWGNNDEGALGRDGPVNEPGEVLLPEPVKLMAVGDSHTITCLKSESIYLWGTYRDGNGAMTGVTTTPRELKEIRR